jgi:hypothetical protein
MKEGENDNKCNAGKKRIARHEQPPEGSNQRSSVLFPIRRPGWRSNGRDTSVNKQQGKLGRFRLQMGSYNGLTDNAADVDWLVASVTLQQEGHLAGSIGTGA